MCRVFNSRGIAIIDYEGVEERIEAHMAAALAAGCRCITVSIPSCQLLYLGNRVRDALAAIADPHCEVSWCFQRRAGCGGGKSILWKSARKSVLGCRKRVR